MTSPDMEREASSPAKEPSDMKVSAQHFSQVLAFERGDNPPQNCAIHPVGFQRTAAEIRRKLSCAVRREPRNLARNDQHGAHTTNVNSRPAAMPQIHEVIPKVI